MRIVKLLTLCTLLGVLLIAAGNAHAANGGNSGCRDSSAILPGPNGCNNYGLCRAFFAGSSTGRGHKRSAPPFAQLTNVACEVCDNDSDDSNDCDDAASEDACVANFCPDSNPAGRGKDPSDLDN